MSRLHTIDFHGTALMLVDRDGQPFVAMKAMVEGMGLDWGGQHKKLAGSPRWGAISVTEIPSAGGPQDEKERLMTCLPLDNLHDGDGWDWRQTKVT